MTSLGGNNQLLGGPDNDIYDKNSSGIDEIFELLGGGNEDEVLFDAGIGEILLHLVDTTIGIQAENDAVLKLDTIGNVTLSREVDHALVWLTKFTNGVTPIEFVNTEGQTTFAANAGAPATVFGGVQANLSIDVDGGTVIFAEDQDLADLTVNTANNAVVEIGTGSQGLSNTVRVYSAALAIPVPGVQLGNGTLPLRFATLLDRNNVVYVGIREAPVGDANLDGAVDAADERLWEQHFGSENTNWGQGNFNNDNWTDATDFNLWNDNKTVTANLDTLSELIRTGGSDAAYDYNHDGDLDLDDRDAFLATEDVTLGDVNFDGLMDAAHMDVILRDFWLADQGWAQGDMNGDGAVDGTDFNLWVAHRPVAAAAPVFGDINLDGVVNATDIDVLFIGLQTIEDSSLDPLFQAHAASVYDLDGDGYADTDDLDYLIHDILNRNYGDANLDGQVNAADLSIISIHWQGFVASWALGVFNGDGYVDEADLAILNANWGS